MRKRISTEFWVSLLLLTALPAARAQTTLFQSEPSPSNFQAVFQNESPSSPAIGTQQTNGKGTTLSIDSFPGAEGPIAALVACATTVGPLAQLGVAVCSKGGTAGPEKNNPLALGSPAATPDVFNLGTGQTFTYSVDFHNNFHGTDIITLFNPKAPDSGATDPTTPTKGAYLGIALTLSTHADDAVLSLQGLNSFAANSLDAASATTPVPPNGSNAWRLVLKLTNNGNGTDTVSASVFSLELKGGSTTETLGATLNPQTITLGTASSNYDLDNSTVGLELGVSNIANINNKFYLTNISLSSAQSAP